MIIHHNHYTQINDEQALPIITRESLRRYHGLDLEVKSAAKGAKGAFKCPLSWHARVFTPIFHTRCNCFIPPQFKAPLQPVCVRSLRVLRFTFLAGGAAGARGGAESG
jgi:hypothetical protein